MASSADHGRIGTTEQTNDLEGFDSMCPMQPDRVPGECPSGALTDALQAFADG